MAPTRALPMSGGSELVVGRDVGRVGESLTVTTLGELDTSTVVMRPLRIVGASRTRRTSRGALWTPRFGD